MPSNMPRTVLSLNGNHDVCEFSYMRLGWLQNGYNLLNRICYSPNNNKGNCFKYASLIRLVIKRCRVQQQSLIGLCETVSHWDTYKSDCETCKKETVYSNTVSNICLQKRDITKGLLELHQLERYIYI